MRRMLRVDRYRRMDRRRALVVQVLVACQFVVGAAPAFAADLPDWLTLRSADALPPAEAKAALRALDEGRAEWLEEGFGFVELSWSTRLTIEAKGVVRFRQRVIRGFVSDTGVQQAANVEIPAKHSWSTVEVLRAQVIRAGGHVEHVERDAVQITDSPQPLLFSDQKIVNLPLRGVEPGAIAVIEYEIVRRIDDEPLPWSAALFTRSMVPVQNQEITVVNRRGADWLTMETDDPALECKEQKSGTTTCWKSNAAPLPIDPVVRSYESIVPHLIIAQRQSWTSYSDRMNALVEGRIDSSAGIRDEVERIRAAFPDDAARARELYRVVANQVRYLGFEHGDSAVVPHRPSETWSKRYGDCKDKVTLYLAMARALGLEAKAVLTSFAYFDLGQVLRPAPSYFDHMIVCVAALAEVDDGCLDVTAAGTPAELPMALQGGVALALAPADARETLRSLPRREVVWTVGIDRDIRLDCEGNREIEVTRSHSGSWGESMRASLLQLGPTDRQRHFDSELSAVLQNLVERPDQKVRGLADTASPWRVTYALRSRDGLRSEGTYTDFYDVDVWLASALRSMVVENRYHDAEGLGLEVRSETTYVLCDRTKVLALGPKLRFESEWGSMSRDYREVEGGLAVTTEVRLPTRRITPAEAGEIRTMLIRMIEESAIRFGFVGPEA